MTITLPESLARRVEELATSLGTTTEAYVTQMLEQQVEFADLGGPESITPRSREQLEEMLLEGLASEPIVADANFWQNFRRKAALLKGQPPTE